MQFDKHSNKHDSLHWGSSGLIFILIFPFRHHWIQLYNDALSLLFSSDKCLSVCQQPRGKGIT